jgi:thioesterase domain-containing protein/acyl carrier protein
VEPGEVAAVLSDAPGIDQCVVAIRELEGAGARLVAYVTADGPGPVALADVRAHARAHLPEHMVPSHMVALAAFPLTPSGKVDMTALPEPVFDRSVLDTTYVAPNGDLEAGLVAIWQDLLGVPEIGVDDDFYDLGGDSLMIVSMVGAIRQRFGTDLPLAAIGEAPTIAALARFVERGTDATRFRSLVRLQPGDPQAKRPLFVVHGGSGNVASFPRLARALPADQPVYALQWNGLDGTRGARTVEAMAQHYLREVRSVQPEGPYHFGGQCIGGLVAREMARRVRAEGDEVPLLVMVDSPNIDSPHFHLDRLSRRERWLAERGAKVLMSKVRAFRQFLRQDRRAKASELLFRARVLAGRVPVRDRERHSGLAMIAAVWRHRIPPVNVPTIYFTTGQRDAMQLGLAGTWDDGLLGWSTHVSETFTTHHVRDRHLEIMFHPEAVGILRHALDEAHALGSVPAAAPGPVDREHDPRPAADPAPRTVRE